MQYLYFEPDNDFTSKPQNSGQNGFNEWDLMKYKPDKNSIDLLNSLGISVSTEWSYSDMVTQVAALSELTADTDSNSVYSNLLYAVSVPDVDFSETIRVETGSYCKNPIFTQWINELGGASYELFSWRQDEGIEIMNSKTVSSNFDNLENANIREFSIGGSARKSLILYKENIKIAQKNRYLDLQRSMGKRDLQILNKVFRNDIDSFADYSSTITGTVLVISPNHGQESDDEITIQNTTNYNGDYNIIKIDNDAFAILVSYNGNETGRLQRKLKQTDWLTCQAKAKADPIDNADSVFDFRFELFLPTGM